MDMRASLVSRTSNECKKDSFGHSSSSNNRSSVKVKRLRNKLTPARTQTTKIPVKQPPNMQKAEAPAQAMSGANISKRRKFVADGVFYAELNEFFQRELAEEGYSGVEVRVTPTVTDIIIRATHTQEVLGEQGRRIREVCLPHFFTMSLDLWVDGML